MYCDGDAAEADRVSTKTVEDYYNWLELKSELRPKPKK